MTDQLPVSREAVAQIISQNIDLDWGAHSLMQGHFEDEHLHDSYPTCPACLQVADALLAAFSFGASSVGPSHSPEKEK